MVDEPSAPIPADSSSQPVPSVTSVVSNQSAGSEPQPEPNRPDSTNPADSITEPTKPANSTPPSILQSDGTQRPESSQVTDLSAEADAKVDKTLSENTQKSFGDLISPQSHPPSAPSTSPIPSPPSDLSNVGNLSNLPPPTPETQPPLSKPSSFGDLLRDVDKSKIPSDLFEIKDTPQETVVPTQPSPQIPPPQPSSPISPPSPPNPNPPEPEAQPRTDEQNSSSTGIVEKIVEKPIEKIVEKEVIKEIPIIDQVEIQKQILSHTQSEQKHSRILANQARQKRRDENLSRIMDLVKRKGKVNNQDIRDFLHVGQSTVSDYLKILVSRGVLKPEGKGKATVYTL